MKRFTFQPKYKSGTAAAALATVFLSYVPAANAGDLLHGLHVLLGHGTHASHQAADYVRPPQRHQAPAREAAYGMPLMTYAAPYEPYVDGGSVVSQTPVLMTESHYQPAGAVVATPPTKHTRHNRHFGRKGHAHMIGINRKTIVCTGYPDDPSSVSCVEKHSEFIPYNSDRRKTGHSW